jgi:predicted nuclease of predicted toxin-antitoxin system
LAQAGHEVERLGDRNPPWSDEEILVEGARTGRAIVTLDKDFGELAVRMGKSHRGIVRLVDLPVSRQAEWCLAAIQEYGGELEAGALLTVSAGRVRIRTQS